MKSFTHISKQWLVINRLVKNGQFNLRGCFLLLLSISLLMACSPRTEEQQIAAINRNLAPDGHLTKTHLYIHWPAEYTKPYARDPGGKEIVPAVTLKIPIEYLAQSLISFENAAKIERHEAGKTEPKESLAIDYYSRINQALLIHDHQITGVFLRVQPGAKPYIPELPYKSDSPEVADRKFNQFVSAYAVIIHRNDYFAVPLSDRTAENPYERPPRINCIDTTCFVHFGVKGRNVQIGGVGEALDSFYKEKAPLSSQKPSKPLFQSLPSQRQTGLPKWHEKVDPTQALLNSFVLPEDSPEVKTLFANP